RPLAGVAGVDERHEALGLAERHEEPPLALEALAQVGPGEREQDLDGDGLAVRGARLEDAPHAAAADFGFDLVRPDFGLHRLAPKIVPSLVTEVTENTERTEALLSVLCVLCDLCVLRGQI